MFREELMFTMYFIHKLTLDFLNELSTNYIDRH